MPIVANRKLNTQKRKFGKREQQSGLDYIEGASGKLQTHPEKVNSRRALKEGETC